MRPDLLATIVTEVSKCMIAHEDELTRLDQAIGDADHGVNVRRGFEAVLGRLDDLRDVPNAEAIQAIGMTLVMTVGGAFGPLIGTALLTLGRSLPCDPTREDLIAGLATALEAVKARGRSDVGHKTLIDVLGPVCDALTQGADPERLTAVAVAAAERTVGMQALRGRAAFLGERSVGHMDPGARSTSLIIAAAAAAYSRARIAR